MRENSKKKSIGVGREGNNCNGQSIVLSGSLWRIFNISLFSRNVNQVLNILESKLDLGTKKYWVVTVNPEFTMEAKKDKEFTRILGESSLNVVDGIGLIWARELDKRTNKNTILVKKIGVAFKIGVEILKGKHCDQIASGSGLMLNLGEIAMKKKFKIFFLGGYGERAKKTAKFFQEKFFLKDKQIAWCEGEPNVNNEEVVKCINEFEPDILLVAYGMKKQEFWINKNIKDLKVGLVMGIGSSFDYYSGDLKRAPDLWKKVGLEWLYSLFQEPKRFKRQLVLPKFIWEVLKR
jgi:N-acetylglucosaminyldiphosphoundecaprenol N-acetyl-beta-D-mannosaminyltransferase